MSVASKLVQSTIKSGAINLALFGPFAFFVWRIMPEWMQGGLKELYSLWPLAWAILVILILYSIYRLAFPSAPKRHWLFMAGVVAFGFGGTHFIFFGTSAWPYSAVKFFVAQCLAAFGIYRLVMRAAERHRKPAVITVAVSLAVVLPLHISLAYSALTNLPCCPNDSFKRSILRRGSGTHEVPPLNKLFKVQYVSGCNECQGNAVVHE